ncbi:MAG TPA: glycosyltransferase family A protein, partial [Gammaproteobacteria bacterium]
LISVIIPTCDRIQHLLKAIASVRQQSFKDIELIIVNDGIQSLPESILQGGDPRPKMLITSGKCGVSHARNTGAAVAAGKWLAFLDDDDWWDTRFLEETLQLIKSDKLDFVACGFWNALREGVYVPGKLSPERLEKEAFLTRNPGVTGSNFLISKAFYEKVGGFDELLPTSNDMDFVLRLIAAGVRYRPLPGRLVYKNEYKMERLTTFSRRKLMGSLHFYNKYKQEMKGDIRRKVQARLYLKIFDYRRLLCRQFVWKYFFMSLRLDFKNTLRRLLSRAWQNVKMIYRTDNP